MLTTAPIIFNRDGSNGREVIRSQKKPIESNGKVVVFPKGTRLKDPKVILNSWQPSLYSGVYKACIATHKRVAILTTDSMRCLPFGME